MPKKYLDGNITVWLNVYKKEKEPDYRGKLDVAGTVYNVSLWINRDVNGVPVHLSGQIDRD